MNIKKFPKTRIATLICLALSSVSFTSLALEEAENEKKATNTAFEVIEVTARKRLESISDVPMSVTALNSGRLNDFGVNDMEGLSTYVPGLDQPKEAIANRISIRGVGSGSNTSFEQAVGTYVDGVYRGRMQQVRSGMFDVERVEVLKGPQVTLYGNSSIGGAISMITAKPDGDFGGEISAKYEFEYQETEFNGAVNIPVTDEFSVRLAGKWRDQSEGWAENITTGNTEPTSEDQAFRLTGVWDTDDFKVTFKHEIGSFDFYGANLESWKHIDKNGKNLPECAPGDPLLAVNGCTTLRGINDRKLDVTTQTGVFSDKTQGSFIESAESYLQFEYMFDDYIFTSITAHSSYDYNQHLDVDLIPTPILQTSTYEEYDQFSQELRLSGDIGDNTDFIVGLYYQNDDFKNDYFLDINLSAALAGAVPSVFHESLNIKPFSRHNTLNQNTKQMAIFTHINHSFTDELRGSIGLRYLDSSKKGSQGVALAGLDHVDSPTMGTPMDLRFLNPMLGGILLGDPNVRPDYLADPTGYVLTIPGLGDINPVVAPSYYAGYSLILKFGTPHQFDDLKRDEEHVMYTVSGEYDITEDTMLYATYSNGAKAGGFDLLYEGASAEEVEFADESAGVFEIGTKTRLDDLILNVAAYYGKYDDLQVSAFNGSVGFLVDNAAKATSKGIEVDFTYALTDSLNVIGLLSYSDFSYDSFPEAGCSTTEKLRTATVEGDAATGVAICDYSGKTVPYHSDLDYTIAGEYFTVIGQDYELRTLLSVTYKGDHFVDRDLDENGVQEAYSLVDFRAELLSLENDWRVSALINNVTDEDYIGFSSMIPLAKQAAFARTLNEGRTIGVEFSYDF